MRYYMPAAIAGYDSDAAATAATCAELLDVRKTGSIITDYDVTVLPPLCADPASLVANVQSDSLHLYVCATVE